MRKTTAAGSKDKKKLLPSTLLAIVVFLFSSQNLNVVIVEARNGAYGTCVEGVDCKPPMGWRSWNSFGPYIDQEKMMKSVDVMTMEFGDPLLFQERTSLKDLGYEDSGLDDNWQACQKGVNGSFHDVNGVPMVNYTLFPDMKKMTDYGKSKGIKMGFYGNNCICTENGKGGPPYFRPSNTTKPSLDDIYEQDSIATIETYGFSSIKLDGCGQFLDLDKYYYYLEKSTNKMGVEGALIENCHWGGNLGLKIDYIPTMDWCPWSYYRTSGKYK